MRAIFTTTKIVKALWALLLFIMSTTAIVHLVGILFNIGALKFAAFLFSPLPIFTIGHMAYQSGYAVIWAVYYMITLYPIVSVALFYKRKTLCTLSCYIMYGISGFLAFGLFLVALDFSAIIPFVVNLVILGIVVTMDVLDRKAKKQAIQETVQEVNSK